MILSPTADPCPWLARIFDVCAAPWVRGRRSGWRVAVAVAVGLVVAFSSASAFAQPNIGPGPGQGGLGQPGGALPQQPSGGGQQGPQTHAASGGETPAQLPTEKAELPEDPNKIPKQLKDKLKSDYDGDATDYDANAEADRLFLGLYYQEKKKDYSFKTILPPLWMEHKVGEDRTSVFGLNYINRRSPDEDWDIFFPIFWKLRHKQTYTTVVGPVMHREGPTGHDNWVAPLFFEGSGEDGHEYMHIPPLLTFHSRTNRDGFSMAGPLFCKWKGGPACDSRTADEIDMGIAPLYFYGRDATSEYELIPPLLHYYSYNEIGDEELDVWGPFWMENSRKGGVFNVLPLFWHNWEGEDEAHTTLFPFFHYGYSGNSRTIITPVFVDHIDDEGAHTIATPLYARHRGRTEVDMITPLFWQYRDPDIQLERTIVAPFFYRNVSNRSNDLVVFPFYGQFERYGISREWWVTPLFRHQKSLTGWETDIFPFFYAGKENNSSHLVVAPILWDFASPSSRATVVFPFFWRFSDRKGVAQLVGNTYYSEEKTKKGKEWEFHFFPFFSYGETPGGHWWNVFYGLAGYSQEGTRSKMRVAYIPFKLSE